SVDINEKDYSVIFGSATFDFREIPIADLNRKMEVSTIFGSAEILLPKDASVEIEANSVFSSTQFPDGSSLTFGDRTFLSDPQGKKEADIELEVNTVFGSTVISH
ncbi:MAG: cell wall-active antibiotics response protein, partial [Clostridiales bacterium]|nr:cell wall-active antibiotics response protein [Clostridiales bacterium]